MNYCQLVTIKVLAFVFSFVLLVHGYGHPVFSQDDEDSLNALLRRMQENSSEDEEPRDLEESDDQPIISPGAPAIHRGNMVPVDEADDESDLEDSLDAPLHEDDEDEQMLETTKPRTLSGGLESGRPRILKQTPEPVFNQPVKPARPNAPSALAPGAYVPIDDSTVGCPFAPQMLKVLYDEIVNGLNGRNVTGRFNTWRSYMRSTLNNSNSLRTGTEVNALARLSWYEELYLDPLTSMFKTEQFSRYLHAGLSSGNSMHLAEAMGEIRRKLDVRKREDDGLKFVRVDTPEQAIQEVIRCISLAQSHHARAVSRLTPAERNTINTQVYNVLCARETHGHTFNNNAAAVQMLNLLLKVDRSAIHDAAEALIPLSDDRLLECLKQLNPSQFQAVVRNGQPMNQIVTPAGTILIGGRGNNTYNLDDPGMTDVVCVIDLGGNDTYYEGTCNFNRPVFVLIDLDGDDKYIATKPGVQGGSLLGVSLLIDCAGNDSYKAVDVAQGSSIGGVGILIDKGGNDSYHALRRAQGSAFAGVGMLIDQGGNDRYHAALWSQGFGHSAGFGVLEDVDGRDHYYLGGMYEDSYPEHAGYEGWGQGLGAGFRGKSGSACGGIGMLLDGGCDDVYEFDYIAHGGGYWMGVGILRDFGGNDQHIAATKQDYQGNPRPGVSSSPRSGVQPRWQRFSSGFGCHFAIGFCFDDEGDDYYEGCIMGMGMGWDLSIGCLCDFGGNDSYRAYGGLMQGAGANGSLGILLNYFGNDTYQGGSQGYASPTVDPKYHNTAQCGGNFSFLVDYGGKDTYSTGAKNNSYNTRGSASGFLIDRPLETEPQEPPPAPPQAQPRPQPQTQPRPQPQQRPPVRPQPPQRR